VAYLAGKYEDEFWNNLMNWYIIELMKTWIQKKDKNMSKGYLKVTDEDAN